MSKIAKTKLKTAKEAIQNKDFEKARDAALTALEYDADNYFAYVCSDPRWKLQLLIPNEGTSFSALRTEISKTTSKASK